MAITHPNAVKQAYADWMVDQLDTGTGDTTGDMIIATTATATLVTIDMSATAFGAASTAGVATMSGSPSGTAGATGTADNFTLRNKANTAKILGAVAATGSDLNLSSTSINSGDKVKITSFTYTAMP